MTAELLAKMFHETYERLAPQHGYETRKESAKPWIDVPERNKALMIAVCSEIIKETRIAEMENIMHWMQATLTGLNVGDVKSGSLLHLKLREIMIAFRALGDQK